MKVVMVVQMSGTRDEQDWPAAGALVDLPDDEAAQLVVNGSARPPVEDKDAHLETAAFGLGAPVEQAATTTKPRSR